MDQESLLRKRKPSSSPKGGNGFQTKKSPQFPPILPPPPSNPQDFPSREWYPLSQESPALNGFPSSQTVSPKPRSSPSVSAKEGIVVQELRVIGKPRDGVFMGLVNIDGEEFSFTKRSLPNGKNVWPGDRVECTIHRDDQTNETVIHKLKLLSRADLPQSEGVIYQYKKSFGFIKTGNEEVYFRSEEVEDGEKIYEGCKVIFHAMTIGSGKTTGIRIRTVKDEPSQNRKGKK